VLVTKKGIIKKTALEAFSRPRAAGIIAVTIEQDDDLLSALLSGGDDEIFIATKKGKSIRFAETDVRPMGRNARGVKGIALRKGDEVVDAAVLAGRPDILTVTEHGYGKRTPVDDYRKQGRGGSGIINMKTVARNGNVVACMPVDDQEQLMIITRAGKIIRMDVDDISRIGRATQGVRVIQTDEDDVVVSATRTADEPDEDGEATNAGAAGSALGGEETKAGDAPEGNDDKGDNG